MAGSKGLHLSDGRAVTPAWWCRIAACVGYMPYMVTTEPSSRSERAAGLAPLRDTGAIRLHTTMRQVVPSATCQYHAGPHST